MSELEVELTPELRLRCPVMTAAGCSGAEHARLIATERLGAIVVGPITVRRQDGEPTPRLVETPAALLSAVGWVSPGVDAVLRGQAAWRRWQAPVVANLAGFSLGEIAELAAALGQAGGVAAVEVDLTCPDLAGAGLSFSALPSTIAAAVGAARAATDLPLIAKIDGREAVAGARAARDAGADVISLVNAPVGMVIDVRSRRPLLGAATGRLYGPATRPLAVWMVYEVARALPEVALIAAGGVTCADDALQFIMAGARAVQVGTANLVDPGASVDIIGELEARLQADGTRVGELIGAAL